MTTQAASPTPASRAAFLRLALLLAPLALALLLAGCRGSGDRDTGGTRQTGLSGNWAATVNPDAVPVNLAMNLRVSGSEVTGRVADAAIENGTASGSGSDRSLRFTTGTITTQGPTGDLTVQGPLEWTATMSGGRLEGTVTGPEGRPARWTAQRQ